MPLTKEERVITDNLIPVKEFKKGFCLLEEGKVANCCYFTIQGCVRSFQILDGDERTTGFFTEGEAIAPLKSYISRQPSEFYLECVEDSVLAVLSYDAEKELYQKIPKMEALCRMNIEEEFGKQQDFLLSFLTKNPEERYLELQRTKPELLQRVPQYQLANYLGIKAESLSRIRKRLSSRD